MALEYAKLTKVQKIAALFVIIGPDNAGKVMRHFENAQLELICKEVAEMPMLDPATQREVLHEFADIVTTGLGSSFGGLGFAQTMLGHAREESVAASILRRCFDGGGGGSGEAGEEIRLMEGRQLMNLLKTEQPQTVAFIVSCMDAKKAAELVTMLAPEMREEVVERLGTMDPTTRESISKVAKNLGSNSDGGSVHTSVRKSGGAKACADVLNALHKDIRKTLITRVEERNATLGAAIRKEVFSFEDLSRLSAPDLQKVLREVDTASLPLALKNAKPDLVTAMLSALSKRAAQSVREEIDMLGSPRPKDVEAAQQRVIQIVRRLEESEEISLEEGGAEDVAA